MKNYARLHELPITAIRPQGWLRTYLLTQRDGLTGHLEHAGAPFNKCSWYGYKEDGIEHWVPYEQNGYWIDGMIRCGLLLGDEFLTAKARRCIQYALDNADADGYLGPDFMKARAGYHRWPHAVFFRAFMADHDSSGDGRVIDALLRHYRHTDHSVHVDGRNVANVEILLWLYGRTGQQWLLEHALAAWEEYNRLHPQADAVVPNMLSPKRPTEHGVTYNELGKLGAIVYMHTGDRRSLAATVNAFAKMRRHSELISGVVSSTERLGGKGSTESHETCDIADYTWGLGYLLLATGQAGYADTIEQACFNAAPGAVRGDFKALQYFSSPNQVVADRTANHHELYRGHAWISYRPAPGTQCCPGEVNRIMPNFAARMWLSDGQGGLVAACYGPSQITAPLGSSRQPVTVIEKTQYPFGERIDFEVRTPHPVRFALHLRIPGWCKKATVTVNGRACGMVQNDAISGGTPKYSWGCSPGGKLRPGTFVKLARAFRDGDVVSLVLPMELRLSRWPEGGVGIHRGPLTFALKIAERWEIDSADKRSSKQFPAWNLYAASKWNYALDIDPRRFRSQIQVVIKEPSDQPWSIDTAPIELRVPARLVKGWRLVRRKQIITRVWDGKDNSLTKLKGSFTFTPPLPDPATLPTRLSKQIETVTLVPYGCTKLRISVFPWTRGQ